MCRKFLAPHSQLIPQDRKSFERNGHVVLFLAVSDPVCFVDVGGGGEEESFSAPGTVSAGPEFADELDAAPFLD
jgi:hypothetical protein